MWKAALMLLLLTGCSRSIGVELYSADTYSRAEIDALNAVSACKRQALTMVQVSRCETRR